MVSNVLKSRCAQHLTMLLLLSQGLIGLPNRIGFELNATTESSWNVYDLSLAFQKVGKTEEKHISSIIWIGTLNQNSRLAG